MPVFDFECPQCRKIFSELVSGKEKIVCPHCGADKARKLFSGFHTVSDATRFETGAADLPSMEQWERARKSADTARSRNVRLKKPSEKTKRLSMKDLRQRAAVHKKS